MPTLNALDPTPEQIKTFLSHHKEDEPVYMLNLLKFKAQATYSDGEAISGRKAYQRYAAAFSQINAGKGITTVFSGNIRGFLVGDGEGEWDAVALVKYPSAQLMFEAVSSEDYRKIHKHRRAGLEGQLLIACDGQSLFPLGGDNDL